MSYFMKGVYVWAHLQKAVDLLTSSSQDFPWMKCKAQELGMELGSFFQWRHGLPTRSLELQCLKALQNKMLALLPFQLLCSWAGNKLVWKSNTGNVVGSQRSGVTCKLGEMLVLVPLEEKTGLNRQNSVSLIQVDSVFLSFLLSGPQIKSCYPTHQLSTLPCLLARCALNILFSTMTCKSGHNKWTWMQSNMGVDSLEDHDSQRHHTANKKTQLNQTLKQQD